MPFTSIKSKIGSADICQNRGYEINPGGFIPCGSERTPSLKIYDDGGWRCFRCNEGGDCMDLLMHLEGMTHREALAHCVSIAGVDLPRMTTVQTRVYRDMEALRAAMKATSLNLPYGKRDFRHPVLFELYKMILIYGPTLSHLEHLRVISERHYSGGWDKKLTPKLNAVIDQLCGGIS